MYRLVGKVYNPKSEEFEVKTCYCFFENIPSAIIAAGYDFSEGHYVTVSDGAVEKFEGNKK